MSRRACVPRPHEATHFQPPRIGGGSRATGLFRRGGLFAPRTPELHDDRHHRQEDDREDHQLEILLHEGLRTEEEPGVGEESDPGETADDVKRNKAAVAHLAGALGVPVWLLLPAPCDWRWMTDRNDSPWYPTMRLFRQERSGEWQPVIAAVAARLSQPTQRPGY